MITGVLSGLAAVSLRWALEEARGIEITNGFYGKLLTVVLPAVGAVLAMVFLKYAISDSTGHGVPEVIAAVTRKGGRIRFRSSISRLIGSFLTIASGGSAGPEAPVVLSGASLGSNLANTFWAPDRVRITAVGCGAAGAIAGIFNAPVAGMVFAVEVIL
ncbi:MAG: chloride channel protein, partial [Deltaproteobacteria bacterium]|nr:chloride channel protein [Deltaproteobacteria bacterium]